MDLNINLTGIQEGKKYCLEFSLSEDGKVTKRATSSRSKKDDGKPSLEDIEKDNKPKLDTPKLEQPKKSIDDFKVESSFGDDKINPV